jgi:hypothetical protein
MSAAVEEPGALAADTDLRPQTLDLLTAYSAILKAVDDQPRVVWVQSRLPRLRIARFRWPARAFVVQHVSRNLDCLRRRHYERCALGQGQENTPEGTAIDNFVLGLNVMRADAGRAGVSPAAPS